MVCSGASCNATVTGTVFDRYRLIVRSGAHVTLKVNIQQHGSVTLVTKHARAWALHQGVCPRWHCEAISEQAGGCLQATDLPVTEAEVTGLEAKGQGSCLTLTQCDELMGSRGDCAFCS